MSVSISEKKTNKKNISVNRNKVVCTTPQTIGINSQYPVFCVMSLLGWVTPATDSNNTVACGWATCRENELEYQYVIMEHSQHKPGPDQGLLIHTNDVYPYISVHLHSNICVIPQVIV